MPSIAKRAHEERINLVVEECLKKFSIGQKNLFGFQTSTCCTNFFVQCFSKIDYIAVTQGPGLAIALEVGINKAKELAKIRFFR